MERTRDISAYIAFRCVKIINELGFARDDGLTASKSDEELQKWIQQEMWSPVESAQ